MKKFFVMGVLLWTCQAQALDFGTLDLGKTVKIIKGVATSVNEVSELQEIELGHGIASNLLGAAPLFNHSGLQRYVNRVGRWIAMQTERPDIPWQFGVLNDDNINAFAAPGGYVFITKGLLARMNSEAELAGVLAHEISHVLKKHHLRALKKVARAELLSDLASLTVEARGGATRLIKLASAGTELYARGLDKADEFESDRLGVILAARAGYDPYGLPAVLQTLQSINPGDSNLALMFKTHPSPVERITLLARQMSPAMDAYEGQPALSERFGQQMLGH